MTKKAVKKDRGTKAQDKAQVVGISASKAFWSAVDKYTKKSKMTRSAAIVQAVVAFLGLKEAKVGSKAVGRPRKSAKKVMKK